MGITLEVQGGYNFNWVREANLNELEGDIGLRVEAAISASIDFKGEGRWAVVVARETDDPVLRVRLFRLKSRELNMAVNASALIRAVTPPLPDKVDDLIKAIFGVHGAQVVKYIGVVEKWTDPKTKLTDLLAAEGSDEAKALVAHVANVPVDQLDDKFEEVRGRVVKLIQAWGDLDHRVAATVMKFMDDKVDLTDVLAVVKQLTTIDGPGLRDLLIQHLGMANFALTPVGKLLESAAGDNVLSLLNQPLENVQKIAGQISKVLDGSVIEESLGRLQQFVESQLNIGIVLNTITETDFNKLDALLKRKLGEFLGSSGLDFTQLEKARAAVRMVLNKRQDWYAAAVKALQNSYNLELTATYQKSTQNTAHFDVTFDFRHDPHGVSNLLQAALSGDFDKVMTAAHPDVRLGLAQLAHGVKRRRHVELTLPFYHFDGMHLNEALATVEAIDDGGRVLVYKLHAQDVSATNHRNSTLAVAVNLASKSGQLRVHEGSGFDYNYGLRQAGKRMTRRELSQQLGPIYQNFPDAPPLATFVDLIDKRTEEAIPNTPDFLGNLFIDLQVNFSADSAKVIGDAWMRPRPDKVRSYEHMSKAIQTALRAVITDTYFQDRNRYQDFQTAQILLCWTSIAPANELLQDGTRPQNRKRVIWDVADVELRRLRLQEHDTAFLLDRRLNSIHDLLMNTSGMQGLADRYHPDENEKIRKRFIDNPGNMLFSGLLLGEGAIVDAAWEAGKAMSDFLATESDKPSLAIKHLEEFGSKLTGAFNQSVGGVFLKGVSRALGTLVFIEATKALAAGTIDIRQNPVLGINAMKSDFTFDPKPFLDSGTIPADKVAVREQLVAVA